MINQDEFLRKYGIEEIFQSSNTSWKTLEEIYDDYENYRCSELEGVCQEFRTFLEKNVTASHHSISYRTKDPEHLIEKIIRKRGIEHSHKYKDINVGNYKEIVRDLVGARILYYVRKNGREFLIPLLRHSQLRGTGIIA